MGTTAVATMPASPTREFTTALVTLMELHGRLEAAMQSVRDPKSDAACLDVYALVEQQYTDALRTFYRKYAP